MLLGQLAPAQQAEGLSDLRHIAHHADKVGGQQRPSRERKDRQCASLLVGQHPDAQPVKLLWITFGDPRQPVKRQPVLPDERGGLAQVKRLAIDRSHQVLDRGQFPACELAPEFAGDQFDGRVAG